MTLRSAVKFVVIDFPEEISWSHKAFGVVWLESRGVAYSESCRDFPQPHEANFEMVSRNGSRELSQTL